MRPFVLLLVVSLPSGAEDPHRTLWIESNGRFVSTPVWISLNKVAKFETRIYDVPARYLVVNIYFPTTEPLGRDNGDVASLPGGDAGVAIRVTDGSGEVVLAEEGMLQRRNFWGGAFGKTERWWQRVIDVDWLSPTFKVTVQVVPASTSPSRIRLELAATNFVISGLAPNPSLERTHQTVIKFAYANLSPAWLAADAGR
jgi:hypothetical protein